MLPEVDGIEQLYKRFFQEAQEVPKKQHAKKNSQKVHKGSSKPYKDGGWTMYVSGNASSFAVLSAARYAVFDRHAKKADEAYWNSSSAPICLKTFTRVLQTSNQAQAISSSEMFIPKVVGIGLRSVFELIKESRELSPDICTKALMALLDIIQYQSPEALKDEPSEVIDPLYELLLAMATGNFDNGTYDFKAVSCSCLISLVIVRGDTGKILNTLTTLIMCPFNASPRKIILPKVLTSLQKCVRVLTHGDYETPDWMSNGVPKSSEIVTLNLNFLKNVKGMACDGDYLYTYSETYSEYGFHKIGTGFGGTVSGHPYVKVVRTSSLPIHSSDVCLGFYQKMLYLIRVYSANQTSNQEIEFLDRETFKKLGRVQLDTPIVLDTSCKPVFNDKDRLCFLDQSANNYVIKSIDPSTGKLVNEVPLILSRRNVRIYGVSELWDSITAESAINSATDEEVSSVATLKDSFIIAVKSGKAYQWSKPVGQSAANCYRSVWSEFILPNPCKVIKVAAGHDGLHCVLLCDSGLAYFLGVSRRGEDCDHGRYRKQPKVLKPKRITKIDGQFIVDVACNNGTTALVSREGLLYMFGKDDTYCDINTGLVKDLKNAKIVQIALGKAHAIALSAKGHVYSFGINNKGQCGRDTCAPQINKNNYPEITNIEPINQMSSINEQNVFSEDFDENKPNVDTCKPGKHNWKHSVCMVCTVCGECTGYSISCLSSIRSNRKPGQECGCGEGDAGCTICGCCRICAREVEDNSELAILGPNGAGDIAGMMRLDVLFGIGDKVKTLQAVKLEDHLKKRLNKREQRQKLHSLQSDADNDSSIQTANNTNIHFQSNNGVFARSFIDDAVNNPGSDIERDAARMTILPPARIFLPSDSPVVQISCGLHHTVLLLSNGKVITFGSNSNGQLGCSLSLSRKGPTILKIPRLKHPIISVSAGSNHTALVSKDGKLYTFGSYSKSQLGRDSGCNHVPLSVEDINPPHTRRAKVVMCCGDQTIVKVDEALINSKILSIAANNDTILMMTSNKCLAINKQDGSCNSYSGNNQIQFDEKHTGMWCFDLLYNNLWHINDISEKVVVTCYNVNTCKKHYDSCSLLSYELALPPTAGISVSRVQVLVNLFTCMDILAQNSAMFPIGISSSQSNIPVASNTIEAKKEYLHINRFASLGGGWGYSGHSVEAIRFSVDCNILLVGFGLFGGRGEYIVKLKLFDLGLEGGEIESDGEIMAETDEITYECAPRQKHPVLFDEPVLLNANRWYVVGCRITGPSSDCGSSGMCSVTSDEQITFTFKSSRKSNNGTDVNAGQIPEILYRTVIPDSLSISTIHTSNSEIHILSDAFSHTVNKECFNALITLLRWSWTTINKNISDMCIPYSHQSLYLDSSKKDTTSICELKRLMFISQSCFHLLRSYIHEIYPDQVDKIKLPENEALANCVVEVRQLLLKILSDIRPHDVLKNMDRIFFDNKGSEVVKIMKCIKWLNQILNECHITFVSCYHAFYPTPHLKLYSLWELLIDKKITDHKNKLLTAVVAALCNTTFRLRELLPILKSSKSSVKSGTSDQDNQYYYPLLVNATTLAAHNNFKSEPNWDSLLAYLLDIIALPVRNALLTNNKPDNDLKSLSTNCSHLVARVVAELSAQATLPEDGAETVNEREILLTTPSRFAKINQNKSWNAGHGSPDAICFWVDRPGIAIAGCGAFAGIGNYEYELELLAEKNQSSEFEDGNRWKSLIVTRGSFGPDDSVLNYVVDLKFDHPIRIKERVKYAIRLRSYGGRTNNGDMGLRCVKGHDNTLFSFNTCSLSLNGTTQSRGQLPYLLYYSHDKNCDFEKKVCNKLKARESTLTLLSTVVDKSLELINIGVEKIKKEPLVYKYLGESAIVNVLLPLVLAHIGPLTSFSKDAKSAIHVLELINKLLPAVTSINLYSANKLDIMHKELSDKLDGLKQSEKFKSCKTEIRDFKCMTTSHHYAWVESDHPYKAATVSNYKVKFPKEVKWLCLEFDPRSCTAQTEDSLQLYIPNYRDFTDDDNKHVVTTPYIPVLKKFSNDPMEWPFAAVMLPGNEVMFSLETASDYLKNDRISRFGFRCLVIGYEVEELSKYQALGYGLVHLETELSFLGGMCVSTLLKCDIILPNDEPVGLEQDSIPTADQVYAAHSAVLKKGFALAPFLNIQQVMDGVLPLSVDGNENRFLREFAACAPHSAGCRLARWLQPESIVEPDSCELSLSTAEVRCGWPAKFTVRTRDQYGNPVHSPGLKVEFFTQATCKSKPSPYVDGCSGSVDDKYFGGHSVPKTYVPYEVVVKDKFRYQPITFMKHYENYSFEELRLASPSVKGDSEKLSMEAQGNGTYTVYWSPAAIGYYDIRVEVDGYPLTKQTKHIEVKEAPFNGAKTDQGQASASPATKSLQHVGKYSAGLRIRTHPSLQSEQIGLVPVKGIIGYTDEISNDDGDWVLLNAESVERHCQRSVGYIEAWCMKCNKCLNGERFLVLANGKTGSEPTTNSPAIAPKPNREISKSPPKSVLPAPPTSPPPPPPPADRADQQKQRKQQQQQQLPVEYKVVVCGASGHNIRNQPTFKATPVGMLVQGNVVSAVDMVTNGEGEWIKLSDESAVAYCGVSCATAWSLAADTSRVVYLKPEIKNDKQNERRVDNEVRDPKFTNRSNANVKPQRFNTSDYVIEKLDIDDNEIKIEKLEKFSPKRKKDVKAIEGLNANPLPIPYSRPRADSRLSNGNMVMMPPSSPRKTVSVKYSGSEKTRQQQQQQQKNASKSDTTSARRTYNHSLSASSDTTAPPTTSSSSVDTHLTSSLSTSVESSADPPAENTTKVEIFASVAQAATQTTPECERVSFVPNSKSKNKIPPKSRSSTKNGVKSEPAPPVSSPESKENSQQEVTVVVQEPKQTVKSALSPSMAESVRAVFAAFLWHEGIVHDAMTCASFLKFYPSLPKKGAVVTRRMTESSRNRKGPQRHSVEVTTGADGYRHIRPNFVKPKTGLTLPTEGAITEESMTSSGNSEIADGCNSKPETAAGSGDGGGGAESGDDRTMVNFLPPALDCIVRLWDEISAVMCQVIDADVTFKRFSTHNRNKGRKAVSSGQQSRINSSALAADEAQNNGEDAADVCGDDNVGNRGDDDDDDDDGDGGDDEDGVLGFARCGGGSGNDGLGNRRNAGAGHGGGGAGRACGDGAADREEQYFRRVMVPASQLQQHQQLQQQQQQQQQQLQQQHHQHLVLLQQQNQLRYPALEAFEIEKDRVEVAVAAAAAGDAQDGNKEPVQCELCGQAYGQPMSYHMLTSHPGCGRSSGGRGYTSNGTYKTGWSGACGEGGIAWYLLCQFCRACYMKRPQRWRVRKTAAAALRPTFVDKSVWNEEVVDGKHVTYRENAMFLLDLASTASRRSTDNETYLESGPWAVGEFKCLANLEASARQQSDTNDAIFLQLRDDSSSSNSGQDVVDGAVTRSFHRSVSMDIEKSPLSRHEMIERRKRINSSVDTDAGLSMVCMPSAALQAIADNTTWIAEDLKHCFSNEKPHKDGDLFTRPSMAFIMQTHNLTDLKRSMKQAVRKAACRSYALQALNWFLHEVSQASCLHDLLWWFVIALSAEVRAPDGTTDSAEPRCRHPLSDLYLAGESVNPLPKVFYRFLQTVSDLMLYLPPGSALQMMAVRCWDINFTAADHMFLHRSKVFSNISKILSHSEEYQDVCEDPTKLNVSESDQYVVRSLKDITVNTEITTSSRPAMVPNLIDQSTETFWESSEDDKSKLKTITIQCTKQSEEPKAVYVHFDNCRDLNNKVAMVIFSSGQTVDQLNKIQSIDVESRFSGWLGVFINDDLHKVIGIELRGTDSSVRVRQIKVLGTVSGECPAFGRQYSYSTIQHRQCENETLKVFRSITFQVFGKLIEGKVTSMDSSVEESKDLKEHMVGILFSQSKLTHLQKQVCTHIVDAIREESAVMREEWESSAGKNDAASNNGGAVTPTDSYCFEMLSMVSALSGSNVGRSYLADQHDLLCNLLSLLHTGSARVQRQVTLLLKRVLPEVSPATLASLTGTRLPSGGFSVASPPSESHKVGLLDIFLGIVAKALTLQVKIKGTNGSKVVNSLRLYDVDLDDAGEGSWWYLKGVSSRKLADDIIQILWDLSNGKLGGNRNWIDTTRAAVAENILNLTRLSKEQRTMDSCVKNPMLWLALASHCVLHPEHAERLSSGQWLKPKNSKPAPPRPLCSNHDDGETAASVQCLTCGNLCVDCDRILHLHRKTKHHQRQVCKEEEEAIRVDLHEGCGRTKLFWLLALADKATLQALVEFRDTARSHTADLVTSPAVHNVQVARVGVCRFCGMVSSDGPLAVGNVCANDDCQLHAQNGCQRVLKCGHLCGGIKDEPLCLPCLHGCAANENASLKQDADDMCMICFTDALSAAPSIQLVCGHVFHYQCCKRVLINRWTGPRIAFGFQQCPICKVPIDHSSLADVLDPIRELMADVKRKALMRLEYEGDCTMKDDHAAAYAMEKYAYYVCFKCNKAYYGGEARCELDVGGTDFDPAELVCGGCSDVARAQMCPKHGTDLLEYKCRYCCSVAVFFCFGTTHFCNACHDDFQRVTNLMPAELPPCPAGPRASALNVDECPLHVKHPPTGEEFALGCGVCRNAHTF